MSNKYYLGVPKGEYHVRFEGCYGDQKLTQIEYVFKALNPEYCDKSISITFPTAFRSFKHKDGVLRDYYRLHCCLAGKKLDISELGISSKFVGLEYQILVGDEGVHIRLLGKKEASND